METIRDNTNESSALLSPEPRRVGAFEVRPVTLATMLALKKLKNPLYLALSGGAEVEEAGVEEEHLVQFLWVHAAPWEEVRRLVVNAGAWREKIQEAVLDFSLKVRLQDTQAMVMLLKEELTAAVAAMATPLPEKYDEDSGKNSQAHPMS